MDDHLETALASLAETIAQHPNAWATHATIGGLAKAIGVLARDIRALRHRVETLERATQPAEPQPDR